MPFPACRVVQIMPAAPDWRAIYADESEEGLVLETPLCGWALIEMPDGATSVVGLDATGEVESCEALRNFLGYAPPGESAARWHREAVRYFHERQREQPPAVLNRMPRPPGHEGAAPRLPAEYSSQKSLRRSRNE